MSPPSSNGKAPELTRWLLLLPPCLPGAALLWAGRALSSRWPAPDPAAAMRARQQAEQLYMAGSVVLLAGLLMAAFITWKILRPPLPDEEEAADVPDSRGKRRA